MTEYIFYKISCIDKNVDYTYIGSTQNFRRRKWEHKSVCTNEANKRYNITLYKTIRENGNWENWTMSPIGKGMFENKVDALIEEQKYINDNNTTLNTNKAFSTKEDRYTYIKQYNNQYRETHKEEIKKYRETHKEELKDKKKNDIELQAKRKEKTTCECGGCYTYAHKACHFKSKRHIDYLSNLQIQVPNSK